MQYIRELEKLNLPESEYAIIGSTVLAVHGIRDNKDIDIITTNKLLNVIKNKFKYQETKFTLKICNTHIEVWKSCPNIKNIDLLIKNSEIINSRPFVKLKYILRYKNGSNKLQDKIDIKLIKNYLKQKQYTKINKSWWNEITAIHLKTKNFYKINELKHGKLTLRDPEIKELGNIKNKKILHLQCHLGLDSLSLALKGANVTGVDISEQAICFAQQLNRDMNLNVKFICSDIYDLPIILRDKFDIVFCSYGILFWLNNLEVWAKIISHYLKKKGFIYLVDFHPIANVVDCDHKNNVMFNQDYFSNNNKPKLWKKERDYANPNYISKNQIYTWQWTIGELISTLTDNKLHIKFFHEFNFAPERIIKNMIKDKINNLFVLKTKRKIPLLFSIKAEKC